MSLDSLEKERAIYAVVLEKPRLKASCSILINPKSLLGALSSLHESDSEFRSCLRLFYFSSCCSFLTVVVQFRIIIIQTLIYTIIALQVIFGYFHCLLFLVSESHICVFTDQGCSSLSLIF